MVIGTKKKWYTVVMPNCHLAIVSEPMARNVLRAVVVRTSIVQTCFYAAARDTRVQGHGGALERLLALVGAGSPRLAQRLGGPRLHDRDDRPGPAGEEASPAASLRRQGLAVPDGGIPGTAAGRRGPRGAPPSRRGRRAVRHGVGGGAHRG